MSSGGNGHSHGHRRRACGPRRRRHARRGGRRTTLLEARAASAAAPPPSARTASTSTRARTRSTSAARCASSRRSASTRRAGTPLPHSVVFLRDGKAIRPGAAGARWYAARARRRARGDERARVDRGERSTTGRARERGRLVRVTTFVADHDALSADVAAPQIASAPGRACATSRAAGSGWSTRWPTPGPAPRRDPAHPRRRPRRSSARRTAGRSRSTTRRCAPDAVVVADGRPRGGREASATALRPRPARRPRSARWTSASTRCPTRARRSRSASTSRPTSPSTRRRGTTATLLSVDVLRAPAARGPRGVLDIVQAGWREKATAAALPPQDDGGHGDRTPGAGGLAGRPPTRRACSSPATGSAPRAGSWTRPSRAAPPRPAPPWPGPGSSPRHDGRRLRGVPAAPDGRRLRDARGAAEAEDIVQDAWLRWDQADRAPCATPRRSWSR